MTRFSIIILSLLLLCGIAQAEEALPCEATSWNTAEENSRAYEFGVEIQNIVRNRDLEGLFDLVDGELWDGPVRLMVEGKEFSDIFSEEWRADILAAEPPCFFLTQSGFYNFYKLSNGTESGYQQGNVIYYEYRESRDEVEKNIMIMHGANVEAYIASDDEPIGWRPLTKNGSGDLLPPHCFVIVWVSADNYEAYFENIPPQVFSEGESEEHFITNPGLYFGKYLSVEDAINPPDKYNTNWLTGLIKDVTDCYKEQEKPHWTELTFDKKRAQTIRVTDENGEELSSELTYDYEILATVPQAVCKKIAPHIKAPCHQAYLVDYFAETGGTVDLFFFNVYGEFDLPDGRKIIVPLKNYDHKTEAVAFLLKHNIANVKIRTQQ